MGEGITSTMVKIGTKLRKKRQQCGLTQQQVSEILGLSPSAISNIEKHKTEPLPSTVSKIMAFLDGEYNTLPSDATTMLNVVIEEMNCLTELVNELKEENAIQKQILVNLVKELKGIE